MNYEFRMRHVWPSVLAFVSGVNFALADHVNLVVGLLTLVLCIWLVYENIMEEKVNERHT